MTVLLDLGTRVLTSPLLLLGSLIGLLTTYVSLLILYRLTLHPLAKYPGPVLAKITDLHLCYHAWKGDRHLEFHRCHEKYGPVVRLGPNLLSFNTNTALKAIYGFKSNVRKADFYTAFPANKHAVNVHSAIDKVQHARKRRVISHAFADSALREMEKYVLGNAEVGVGIIGQDLKLSHQQQQQMGEKAVAGDGWSRPRNMASWADWLTFDIMGDLVFGKAFGMLESPENRFAVDLVSNAARRHLICGTSLFIHNYHLDKLFFRKIAAKRQQYMTYSKSHALARTSASGNDKCDRKDFFYYLLNARDPETGLGFSQNELWGESNLFIIAGSDTTSTALAATLFYLSHNTECSAILVQEIRSAFGSTKEIRQGPALNSCVYLRATIDEAMRLSPPVAGALPRCVLPGGLLVDEHFVPAGVDVCVPHYALHHNERYFERAYEYLPTRWLTSSSGSEMERAVETQRVEMARSAFAPFSVGPRGCIGKGMAYLELSISIARLLWEYDIRVAPGTTLGVGSAELGDGRMRKGEYQLRDTFTSVKDGPLLQFRRREDL